MNLRKYNTDPAILLEQGKAIMTSSDESKYLFRVFAVNMVLSGTPASQVGASAGYTKAAVTGWVKNEYDGSVTMEIQGREEEIDKVIQAIGNARYIKIDRTLSRNTAVIPDEKSFRVRY